MYGLAHTVPSLTNTSLAPQDKDFVPAQNIMPQGTSTRVPDIASAANKPVAAINVSPPNVEELKHQLTNLELSEEQASTLLSKYGPVKVKALVDYEMKRRAGDKESVSNHAKSASGPQVVVHGAQQAQKQNPGAPEMPSNGAGVNESEPSTGISAQAANPYLELREALAQQGGNRSREEVLELLRQRRESYLKAVQEPSSGPNR